MGHLRMLLESKEKIAAALRSRQKTYVEKTIKGSTKEILKEKIALEEQDGWYVLRKRGKKSCRIGKDKPVDECLEDELWTIVARCGFDELSKGRDFTISEGLGGAPRQIDVFAKDRETAICIECTSAHSPKKKRLDSLIEKIISIRPKAMESINAHYRKDPKLKIRWVIATRDIIWSDAHLLKASTAKIVVLRDEEIDYFTMLAKQYKHAAKYQLLANIFKEEEIKGIQLKVLATRGHMGGQAFYSFIINPRDLLKIAYINHKARDIEDLETYQRMLSPNRLKKIAKYIDKGGQFPTNIVINIKNKGRKLNFEGKAKIGDSAIGVLSLPKKYASAWVIDGQHRLYGFTQSKRAAIPTDRTTFPVLAYENLPSIEEAKLFVDINHEQVRVKKNLLVQIYSGLRWDSDDLSERIDALCSRVVIELNKHKGTPIQDRIKTDNRKKTNHRCLTLTSFCDGLMENKLFGEIKKAGFSPGPLWDSNSKEMNKTLRKAVDILSGYLTFFAANLPEHWNLGDDKGGYLSTNNGIRALLGVLKEILNHLESEHHISTDYNSAEELLPMFEKYVVPILEFFKNASPDEIKPFRDKVALSGVRMNILTMLSFVHKSDSDFKPAGLMDYLSTMDQEGTKEARVLIDRISICIFSVTIELLRRNLGENWWFDGIPISVRTSCSKLQQEDKGNKEIHQYLFLVDYKTIAIANWELLKDYYSLEQGGNREKQLSWVVKLNEIRTITHHPEKGLASKEQVALVRNINSKVLEKFVVPDKNAPPVGVS